jgi:hypothetical protein
MLEWLKTSIAGIVLLGAIGSMLAVRILKLALFLIRRTTPKVRSATDRVLLIFRAPHYVREHLHSSQHVPQLIVTCI